jgi:DNA-directed RNA polymerase sigma subunit (sigma70/sigma32)
MRCEKTGVKTSLFTNRAQVHAVRELPARVRQNGDVQTDTPAELQELRARYIASLDELDQVADRLITALRKAREARALARELVTSGRQLKEIDEALDPQPLRSSVADALAELERRRHTTQRLLFTLLQSEGQTLAEIGRTYGISRQLVSRLVNEPEPGHSN